jgi:hypothetical protein
LARPAADIHAIRHHTEAYPCRQSSMVADRDTFLRAIPAGRLGKPDNIEGLSMLLPLR